eukprot:m.100632 g.100632  ORF g.100632 m.100632 type:complete len:68 (+) comp16782_c2_seq22:2023-2226(+)
MKKADDLERRTTNPSHADIPEGAFHVQAHVCNLNIPISTIPPRARQDAIIAKAPKPVTSAAVCSQTG